MHWHLAALFTLIRNHPHALKVYLLLWVGAVIVTAARWGF